VERGDVDAGLLIHEGQLTFQDRGLHLLADMGEWWFQETGLPLPLGGNVIRKDLGPELIATISRHLHASIAYGLEHRPNALEHAMHYARGLDPSRADTFVGMYVNQWTLDYGERGRGAVRLLLDEGHKAGIIPHAVHVKLLIRQILALRKPLHRFRPARLIPVVGSPDQAASRPPPSPRLPSWSPTRASARQPSSAPMTSMR
jgi:predicted solute-binding protein